MKTSIASRFLVLAGILLAGVAIAQGQLMPALQLHLEPPGISNEFSATPELTWDAEAGVSYVIETTTNLADSDSWRGTEVAVKSAAGPIKWMAPESLQGTKYYRLVTQPTIYDVQPVFVNSDDTNALLYLIGQLLPSNAIVVINGHNFTATSVSNGVCSVILNGLPPGTPITGTISVLDGGTSNVVATLPVQSPIYYGTNLTAELLQGPPELPPASPQSLGIAIFASKKGYDYYQAQSALGAFLSKKGYDYYKASSDRAAYASKKGYDYWMARSDLGVFLSKKGYDCYQAQSALGTFASKKGYDYYQAQSALQQTGSAKRGYDYYQAQSDINAAGLHNNPAFQNNNNEGTIPDRSGELFRTMPHSGEVQFEVADLAIPGAMLDFAWTRTYRSRTGPTTAQGAGWDFSYNVSLTQNGDGTVTLYPGNGRADTFYPDGTNGWFRDEYFCQIIDLNSDSYPDVLFADGSRWMFNPLATGGTLALAQIIDRNGNTIALNYDGFGRLAEIVDDLDRTNTVSYGADGQIESVTDFSGRSVHYEYDTDGNLTACISPPTSDFPGGITNRYTYSSGYANAAENHLLESVIDGKGQVRYKHVYQHNQTDLEFLRCISTQNGTNPPVQFTYLPAIPALSNSFAIAKIIICDAVGNLKECFYDSRGRCVRELDYTGRCDPNLPVTETENRPTGKLRVDDPDYYETQWTWNSDSLCTSVTCPDGSCAEYTYQRAFNQNSSRSNHPHASVIDNRLHNGDLRVLRIYAAPGGGADLDGDGVNDITELAWHFDYDPRFGSPAARGKKLFVGNLPYAGAVANSAAKNPWKGTLSSGAGWSIVPVGNGVAINVKGTGAEKNRTCNYMNNPMSSPRTSIGDCDDNDPKRHHPTLVLADLDGDGPLDFAVSMTDPRGNVTTGSYDAKGNRTKTTATGDYLPAHNWKLEIDRCYNLQGQLTTITNAPDANGYRRVDKIDYYSSGPQTGWPQSIAIDEPGVHLTSSFEYDAVGNLTRYVDPRTNDWLFTYDALNRCVSSQTPENAFGSRTTSTLTYDANGNLVQSSTGLIDETGVFQHDVVSTVEYDGIDRCVAVANQVSPGVFVTNRFAYDANGQLVQVESPLAVSGEDSHAIAQFEHDERGLLFRVIGAPGSSVAGTNEWSYDLNGQPRLKLGAANGGVERPGNSFSYDGLGRLTSVADPMGNVTRYACDRNGNLTLVRCYGETNDAPGGKNNRLLAESRYSFDGFDRCVRQVDSFFDIFTLAPIGDGAATTTLAYAPNGTCTSVTDDNGHVTSFSYDTAGRLSLVTDPKLNTMNYAYDDSGNVISVTQSDHPDNAGITQEFVLTRAFDKLHRLLRSVDNVGNTNSYAYDSLGRLTRQTDPNGGISVLEYDDLGRWDKLKIDSNGDGAIGPNDSIWLRQWDDNSRLASVTDANTNTTSYAYDSLGNCIHVMNGDGTVIQLIWSPRSNLIGMEDANASTVTNIYDLCDRIVHRDVAARNLAVATTTFEDFNYDGLSRCVSAVNDISTVTFSYDSLGNCVRSVQDGYASTSTFDGVGNCLSVTYPSTRVVSYTYDGADDVTSMSTSTGGAPSLLASFTYAGPGRLAKISRANGIDTLFQWDGRNGQANAQGDFGWQQISGISHQSSSGAVVLDRRTCYYDRNQNKIGRVQNLPFVQGQDLTTNLWSYDGQDQLRQSTLFRGNSVASKFYTLDGNGNRMTVTNDGVPEDYLMDDTLPVPGDFQMNQYTMTPFGSQMFDENGNLVGSGNVSEAYQYVYDYADRLVAVTNLSDGTVVVNFGYDALGRRISKTTGGNGTPVVTRQFIYGKEGSRVREVRQSGTLIDSALNLTDDGLTVYRASNGGTSTYYLCDDMENTLALMDDSGNVIERYDYDDFGQPSFMDGDGSPLVGGDGLPVTESAFGNPLLFQGMEWDGETGLYLARNVLVDRDSVPKVSDFGMSRKSVGEGAFGVVYLGPKTGRALSRNGGCGGGACSDVFDGNAWTLKKEEGGRHTPFQNRTVLREKFQDGDIPTQDDFSSVSRAEVRVDKFHVRQEFGPTQGR